VHGSAAFFVIPAIVQQLERRPACRPISASRSSRISRSADRFAKNRVWIFGAYRRVQEDQTVNNAQVPLQRRGNQIYIKGTAELSAGQRISASFQWDRTDAINAVLRTTGTGAPSTTVGLSSATPALAASSAWGSLVTGGPLAGVNYTWVARSNLLFQFIGSEMVNKPQNSEPQGGESAPASHPDQRGRQHHRQPDDDSRRKVISGPPTSPIARCSISIPRSAFP